MPLVQFPWTEHLAWPEWQQKEL